MQQKVMSCRAADMFGPYNIRVAAQHRVEIQKRKHYALRQFYTDQLEVQSSYPITA